jgi:hypothetical protein
VTDAGLAHVDGLTSVKDLDLSDSRVTAFQDLCRTLPTASVVFKPRE